MTKAKKKAAPAIENAAALYKLTGNPLYAWWGIAVALSIDLPLPPVLKQYLQRVSKTLSNPRSDPGKDTAQHVLRALELNKSGGPSYFFQRKKAANLKSILLRARLLATRYEGENAAPSKSFEDALERAAEDAGVDSASIKRQLRRIKQTKPR